MNTSTHPLGTLIETDVLVIGSGASGCGAALGAREQGLRVLLMDKGKLESSGCIGGGNDHYMAVLDEEGVAHDAAEDLIKFYAKPLNGWTPAMLRNGWYAHMKPMLEKLEAAGVEFGRTPDGRYHRTQGFGQPGTWWVHIANGMTIKRVMARIVRESGVDVLDRVMAVKILTDGGKACGALGWNVSTGEFYIIRAKTVVSAQGRSATRGTDNSTHNPYNVWMYPYNTSAGVVLGYDAGAAVTELDTYQRATMLPKGYGCPGMNGINSSGAHEINALGERFMGKYDPMWENGGHLPGTARRVRPAFLYGYAACGRSRGSRAAGHPDARRQGHVRRLGGMHRYRLPAQAPRSGNRRTDLRRDHRRERPV